MKKIIAIIMCLITSCFCMTACGQKATTVYDNNGNVIITVENGQLQTKYSEYAELSLQEVYAIIATIKSVSEDEAKELFLKGGYEVHTYFSPKAHDSLVSACEQLDEGVNFGATITDLNGGICAIYSFGTGGERFAQAKQSPHSSLKPLSVYAPAIESGVINWSSVFEDSPYKITDIGSDRNEWPRNATGVYSYKNTDICDAIKHSINTISVKTLKQYGVDNSIKFLYNNFELSLEYEKEVLNKSGEDEIIGNLALGSLSQGVTTVDMAGYYQIFANGGTYTNPHTVKKICNSNGKTIYEDANKPKRVISNETASIMNKMLQEVVKPGGTGQEAFCDRIAVAGKTGTGEKFVDNWFVGVTPEYSCAVWHSKYNKNIAPQLFSYIIKNVTNNTELSFTENTALKQAVYCKQSGLLFTDACKEISVGYYANKIPEGYCNLH